MFTLSDIASSLQAIGVIVGIIIFLLQYQRRTRELGYSAYVSTANVYVDLEKEMMKNDNLRKIYDYSDQYRTLSDDAKSRYHCFQALLMLFEVVYFSRRWMSDEEWQGWREWMMEMKNESNEFGKVLADNKNLYAKSFVDFLYAS